MKLVYENWNNKDWIVMIICNLGIFTFISISVIYKYGVKSVLFALGFCLIILIVEILLATSEIGPPGM